MEDKKKRLMKKQIVFTDTEIIESAMELGLREVGARVEFWGMVREKEGEEKLAGLYYEAYEPMAVQELGRIFDELAVEYPCVEVQMIHRLGWVPVGEASLFMRVLGVHRGEALQFLGASIDRLKEAVPIWKRV